MQVVTGEEEEVVISLNKNRIVLSINLINYELQIYIVIFQNKRSIEMQEGRL